MNDNALNKKLDEIATKKGIENLTNLVNSLHDREGCLQDLSISTFKIKRLLLYKKGSMVNISRYRSLKIGLVCYLLVYLKL